MIRTLFHNLNNEQQLSVTELTPPMIIFGLKGVENDNIYVPLSFCWELKFVNCIVNCIEVRFELPELYCNCIGWYCGLVILYCYCIAKILIAYYCIWIVLFSKSPYWSNPAVCCLWPPLPPHSQREAASLQLFWFIYWLANVILGWENPVSAGGVQD